MTETRLGFRVVSQARACAPSHNSRPPATQKAASSRLHALSCFPLPAEGYALACQFGHVLALNDSNSVNLQLVPPQSSLPRKQAVKVDRYV
jgi:hypothetical protein